MEPLEDQIQDVIQRGGRPVLFELWPRWVRVRFGGEWIADSKRVRLLIEPRRLPVFYFPEADVRTDLLRPSERKGASSQGKRVYHHVEAGGRRAGDAAWTFIEPSADHGFLAGHIGFYWEAMDAWFEEDDEVFVHPRDPYHRVDVCASSRHVRVLAGDEVLADSRRPHLLFETTLPTRYYMPKLDVRMDLLEPSSTRTRCPYKGEAVYWSARMPSCLIEDVCWSYPAPIPECPRIENLVCFFQERVDTVEVDGEVQPVPRTPWSRPNRPMSTGGEPNERSTTGPGA
jgi:uncharacterized protein (DUF427 family)